jgi:lipopolysaccharide export system permease protein
LSILSRYLGREVLSGAMASALVLTFLGLTGRLVVYLNEAAQGLLAPDLVLVAILGRIPGALQIVLPLAFFLGVLLALGRLYADQEASALRASGAGIGFLARALWLPTLGMSLTVAALALYWAPATAGWVSQRLSEAESVATLNGLAPQRFQSIGGDAIFFAGDSSAESNQLLDVFIHQNQATPSVIRAERAWQRLDNQSGQRYLVLENGQRWTGLPGQAEWSALEFDEYLVRLDVAQTQAKPPRLQARASAELQAGNAKEQAQYHWRLALVLMVPLALALGLAIGPIAPRAGRWSKFLPGVVVFICYYGFVNFAQSKQADGDWPMFIALWPVHLIMLAVIAGLMARNRARGHA